jgi:catechol 2,3-dioxygenase-like lactoylglutathione lyase family enzyme
MSVSKLDHVHVTANDPVEAAQFFVKVIGGRITAERGSPGQEMIDVDLGGVTVRITRNTGADENWKGLRFGLHHLGLFVDDIDQVAVDMKTSGAEFVLPISSPKPGVKYAFIKSPEGVLMELTEEKNMSIDR